MLKVLYGRDVNDVTSSAALAKLEALYHEKSSLVVEVEELQRSVSFRPDTFCFYFLLGFQTK